MAKSQKPKRSWWSRFVPASVSDLEELEERLEMKVSEIEAELAEQKRLAAEARTEITAKVETLTNRVAELEAAVAEMDPELPQPVVDLFAAVKSDLQALADVVPGSPTPPS